MNPYVELRCERHGATAGWECSACHRPLCPDCACLKQIPPVTLLACGRCGELAEPLLRHKGRAATLAQRLPGAFVFPLRGEGLAAWLGIALWLWITSWLGLVGLLVGWGAVLGSLFGVTRSTARGSDQLELSDFQDPFHSIVLPIVRFVVALVPVWVGAALSVKLGLPWLEWVSLGIALLWSPTAFIGAATSASVVDMLNPVRVLGATTRIGTDFGVYLLSLGGVALIMVLSVPTAVLLNKLQVPVVAGVATQLVLVYGPMVGARIAGLVLLLHGPVFGWGEELDSYEAVLGETQPRGEAPARERTLPRHLPDAIELEPEPEPWRPAPQPLDRFAALEVNPHAEAPPEVSSFDVALLPSFGAQAAADIRRAVAKGDAESALDGFRSTGLSSAEALSFEELLWLGQTAAAHIDYESAELAFGNAAQRTAEPEALGRARVMLARLLAERLARPDDATKWMRRIVTEQPGTAAASYAERWLAGTPSP